MGLNPYRVIIRPINTEKSHTQSSLGQYVFEVDDKANKTEVALAVTDIFDVDVVKVNIINRAAKMGRWGRKKVRKKSSYKRAIVTLASGQKIDLMDGL